MSPVLAIAIGVWMLVNAGLLYDVDMMDTKEEVAQFVAMINLCFGVILFAVGLLGVLE